MPENRIAFLIDYLKQSLKEKNLSSIPKILVLWRLYVFPFIIREQAVWEYEDWFAWSMNWKSRHKIQGFFWVSIVVVPVTQPCPTLFDPMDWGLWTKEFSRREHWSGSPFPSPSSEQWPSYLPLCSVKNADVKATSSIQT